MKETSGQSRRVFLRELAGRIVRIGSGGWMAAATVAAPVGHETGVKPASAAGPDGISRTDSGVSDELLAGLNDLTGILEP